MGRVSAAVLFSSDAAPGVSTPEVGREERTLAGKGLWTFLDQALVSGTNFMAGVALARLCSQQEYGAFAVGFVTLMLLVGIQRSLMTDPLSVLTADRDPSDLRASVAAVRRGQGWGAAAAALLLGATALAFALGRQTSTAGALAGSSVAAYFFLGHDFLRRLLFIRLDPRAVFRMDAVFSTVYIGGVAALWLSGFALSALAVLLVMALAAGASRLYGLHLMRELTCDRIEPGLLRANFRFGRWTLGDFLGGALSIQGAVYLSAGFGGNASAATLESARLILAPLQILIIGGSGFLIPWASQRLAASGARGLLRAMRPLAAVWGLAFVVYPLLVAAAPGRWLELFYLGRYPDAERALVLWAGVYAVMGLAQLPWIVILALRRPDLSMWLSLTVGALSLLTMAGLAPTWNVDGVIAGRLIGQVLSLIALVYIARRLLRQAAVAEECES